MMHYFILSLILFASPFLPATSLLSDDNPICDADAKRFATMVCLGDRTFFVDQHGRCGCLMARELLSPVICKNKSLRRCYEGEKFSQLYHYRKHATGALQQVYAGCGCFASYDVDESSTTYSDTSDDDYEDEGAIIYDVD